MSNDPASKNQTGKNRELIESFYQAFSQKDYQTMGRCYHPDATFQDEAFSLQGREIAAMWHMLCERGKDMKLDYQVSEHDGVITAHWEPVYTFSQTGRVVHNIIDATFRFKDGKIIEHRDRFDFWRWSRQALGIPGLLLGWSGMLRGKVGKMASASLASFIRAHDEYQ